MEVTIEGEVYDIDEVMSHGHLKVIRAGRLEWYVAEDTEAAGVAARDYWSEMATNDSKEFTCMVGEDTLVKWGLGQYAGPGNSQVKSLEEWLDLHLDIPEETWGHYDGSELDVTDSSQELQDELGFIPTVAYRHN